MDSLKFLAVIPARYASTRFPGKPLARLGGEPVIRYVWKQVTQVFADAAVATDDPRIYDAVEAFGGRAVMTSPDHRSGTARCFDDPSTDIATLVKPFTEADGLDALENPNSPKVVLGSAGQALYFSRSVIPYLRGVPREEWLARHTFYKHIGMYAFRRETLYKVTALPQSALERAESLEQLRWLENGFRIRAGISDVETIGIDTPEDLAKAEEFLKLKTKN